MSARGDTSRGWLDRACGRRIGHASLHICGLCTICMYIFFLGGDVILAA